MSERSNDILEELGADFKFPVNFGDGIVFEYKYKFGSEMRCERLKSKVREERPRVVNLDIFSYLFSFGAVHHYAKLNLGYLDYFWAANGQRYRGTVGYSASVPLAARHLEIEIMRPVDKRDLDHDRSQADLSGDSFLYGRMKKDDWTHGFWSDKEARDAAVSFFKNHFAPGWVLAGKYDDSVIATS